MRTTLAIDDDVLIYARAMAQRDSRSVGEVVSKLARAGMQNRLPDGVTRSKLGFPILPKRGVVITLDLVNALRDDEK